MDLAKRAGRAAVTALALVAADPAAAEFGRPLTLSRPGTHGSGPAVAVGPNGTAVVAWLNAPTGGDKSIDGRAVPPDDTPGPIIRFSGPGNFAPPSVGMDAAGAALVGWRGNGIFARQRAADGTLGRRETILPPTARVGARRDGGGGGSIGAIATSSDGYTLFVWPSVADGKLRGRYRFPGGALGSVMVLADNGPISGLPEVAIAPPGHALVVWSFASSGKTRVYGVPVTVGGGAGPVAPLSNDVVTTAVQPEVAMAADGAVVVTWLDNGGVKTRTGASIFGLAQETTVAPPPAAVPQVAINAAGTVAVAWQGSAPGGENTTNLRVGTEPPQSVGDLRSSAPRVALDERGRVAVAYTQFDGAVTRIAVRVTNPKGRFRTPAELLSKPGQSAAQHALAMSDEGDALVAWQLRDAGGWLRIQAAAGP